MSDINISDFDFEDSEELKRFYTDHIEDTFNSKWSFLRRFREDQT